MLRSLVYGPDKWQQSSLQLLGYLSKSTVGNVRKSKEKKQRKRILHSSSSMCPARMDGQINQFNFLSPLIHRWTIKWPSLFFPLFINWDASTQYNILPQDQGESPALSSASCQSSWNTLLPLICDTSSLWWPKKAAGFISMLAVQGTQWMSNTCWMNDEQRAWEMNKLNTFNTFGSLTVHLSPSFQELWLQGPNCYAKVSAASKNCKSFVEVWTRPLGGTHTGM